MVFHDDVASPLSDRSKTLLREGLHNFLPADYRQRQSDCNFNKLSLGLLGLSLLGKMLQDQLYSPPDIGEGFLLSFALTYRLRKLNALDGVTSNLLRL